MNSQTFSNWNGIMTNGFRSFTKITHLNFKKKSGLN